MILMWFLARNFLDYTKIVGDDYESQGDFITVIHIIILVLLLSFLAFLLSLFIF